MTHRYYYLGTINTRIKKTLYSDRVNHISLSVICYENYKRHHMSYKVKHRTLKPSYRTLKNTK